MPALWVVPLAVVHCACGIAAYCDMRYRLIPQPLVIVTALSGIAIQTLRSGAAGLASSVEAGVAALVVLGLLYWAGFMGGGDVKLFAAISCAIGLDQLLLFTKTTGLLGALLAFTYLAAGAVRIRGSAQGLPYGVAVAGAGVITLFRAQ
jgi:prepilin peptidase CpaA